MLEYRKLDDFELKYNREFLKHDVAKHVSICNCKHCSRYLRTDYIYMFSMLSVYQYIFLKLD